MSEKGTKLRTESNRECYDRTKYAAYVQRNIVTRWLNVYTVWAFEKSDSISLEEIDILAIQCCQ